MSTSWSIENEKRFPKLEKDLRAEVAIIGGGLTGVWCAYLLAKAGQKVILLEKNKIGHGETEYTTAFITQIIDTSLVELTQIFGEEVAMLVWQSHKEAIDLIEEVIKEEGIECGFERLPLYIYAANGLEYNKLLREHRQARKLGMETRIGWQKDLGFKNSGVLVAPHQAKYQPMKFIQGLAQAAERAGAKIYEGAEVTELSGETPVVVSTKDGHHAEAREIIIATYDPLGNPPVTRFKKGMYVSYVYELEIPEGKIKDGLYQDSHAPYHYFRVEGARMIVGGEDHRKEIPKMEERSYRALEGFIKRTFPNLHYTIKKKWNGGILEPSDGLALIGEVAPYRYVACCFSGNGMTYAPMAGKILTDIIVGEGNKYVPIYDPTRTLTWRALTHKVLDYMNEFFGGAAKNFLRYIK